MIGDTPDILLYHAAREVWPKRHQSRGPRRGTWGDWFHERYGITIEQAAAWFKEHGKPEDPFRWGGDARPDPAGQQDPIRPGVPVPPGPQVEGGLRPGRAPGAD
jgi:hypothetical protein